jgi:hypothetical protein
LNNLCLPVVDAANLGIQSLRRRDCVTFAFLAALLGV